MVINYREVVGWEKPARLYYGFFTSKQMLSIENSILDCDKVMYNKRKTNTEKYKNEPKNKYYIQLITDDFVKFEELIELQEEVKYKLDKEYRTYII